MIKHDINKVNLDNPLEGKIPQIIEYFVKFYGEKYRERITDRITNSTLVFANIYNDEMESDNSIKHSYDFDVNEKFEKFLKEKYNAEVLSEEVYCNYYYAKSYAKMRTNTEKSKLVEYLNCFSNFKGLTLEELQDKEKQVEEFVTDIFSYTDDLLKQRDELYKEEKKEYIRITREKTEKIDKNYKNELNKTVCASIFKHFNIDFTPKNVKEVLKFVPTYVDMLMKLPDFVTDFDKDRYGFMFFKLHALEGDTSKSYKPLNMKQIQAFKQDVDNLQLVDELTELEHKKFFELNNLYVPYEELINKNVTDKKFILINGLEALRNEEAEAATYFPASLDEPNKTKAVCVFNSFYNLSSSDIIHELNHVVEADIKLSKNNIVSIKTGFRYTKQYLEGDSTGDYFYPDAKHDFAIFNEVVNDYLTNKINDILIKDNFRIGDVKLPSTTSAYADLFPIFKDFIEENMKDIIRCRMSSKPLLFNKFIGEDNYQKLAYYSDKIFELYRKYDIVSDVLEKVHIYDEIESKRGENSIFELAKKPEELTAEAKEVLDYVKKIEAVFRRIKRQQKIKSNNNIASSEDEKLIK